MGHARPMALRIDRAASDLVDRAEALWDSCRHSRNHRSVLLSSPYLSAGLMAVAAIGGAVLMFAPVASPAGQEVQAAPRQAAAAAPAKPSPPDATAPIPKVVEVTPKVVEVTAAVAKPAPEPARTVVAAAQVKPAPAPPPAPSSERPAPSFASRPVFTTLPFEPPATTGATQAPEADEHGSAGPAAAEDFVGVWAVSEKACIPNVEREGYLPTIINAHGAWAGETTCAFKGGHREGNSWMVPAVCSDGAKRWKSDVQLTVRGRRLTWKSQSGSRHYVRCDHPRADQAALQRPH